MGDRRVLALLGGEVVPAETPILRGDDLGVLRGDGIFEALHVRDGQPWLLSQHLARMVDSARRLDLALPTPEQLTKLVETVVAAWPMDQEGVLRVVCTRGPEDGGDPTIFASVSGVSPAQIAARRQGVAVVTANLGMSAMLKPGSPWLLGGAKTVSYAVNMASLRWAKSSGADDVLWVSGDGYALEAPTSSLVWLDGQTLCTIPPESTGILPGITAAHLLEHAGELGWTTDERLITPAELIDTAGAWFTSSIRGLAAIRTLDGLALPFDEAVTARIRTLLGFA